MVARVNGKGFTIRYEMYNCQLVLLALHNLRPVWPRTVQISLTRTLDGKDICFIVTQIGETRVYTVKIKQIVNQQEVKTALRIKKKKESNRTRHLASSTDLFSSEISWWNEPQNSTSFKIVDERDRGRRVARHANVETRNFGRWRVTQANNKSV